MLVCSRHKATICDEICVRAQIPPQTLLYSNKVSSIVEAKEANNMKSKIKRIIKIGVIITALLTVTTGSVSACTGFTASDDDERVLAGTNFDLSFNFDVYMHFFPAEEGKYGRVIFEIPWPITEDDPPYLRDPDWICPKHGMNDQGLYSDIFITPDLVPVNSSDKPYFFSEDPDYYGWAYWTYCLANCATISEVLDIFDQYNLRVQVYWQCFFADRNGDSVIIEGDEIIEGFE